MKTYKDCTPAEVLEFIAAQAEPISGLAIVGGLSWIKKRRVLDALTTLVQGGAIVRTGKRGDYFYAIPKPEN